MSIAMQEKFASAPSADNALAFAVGFSVIWLLTLVNIAGVREIRGKPAICQRARTDAGRLRRRQSWGHDDGLHNPH